jgi:integrative and conjugative element protein (TIGR02256 family)
VVGALQEAEHLWRFPDLECTVLIPDDVLAAMRMVAASACPQETGGTLVGHYSEDRRRALVTRALEAETGACRKRTRFYRPSDDVDRQLARVYDESAGTTHYLGEWHTHPGAVPTPSSTDLSTLKGLARSRCVATDTPFMVILGGDFGAPNISCTLAEDSGRILIGLYEGSSSPKSEVAGE